MKKNKRSRYVLIILPLVFVWAGSEFGRDNYPNDPEYIYLLNALCICDGQGVGHVDNPGTTLMQVGAGTIGLMHLFSNPENETLIKHTLQNPDKFIEGIRKVIVTSNAIFLLLFGWIVFKKTKSVWLALFFQVSTFFSVYILEVTWAKLSPEALLFLITGFYVILVLYYYLEQDKNQWKYVFLFAIITGAGLGTKATFLPLIVLPLIVLPAVKKKLFYLLLIIPSFVLFTLPAIPEYGRMFFWFRDLISHSGIYGHGETGIIDTKTYLPNIQKILFNNPLILIVLSAGILTLFGGFILEKKTNIKNDIKFLIGVLGTFLFGILLTAKHYNGNHYLIPVLLLSGMFFFLMINIIKRISEHETVNSFLLPLIVIVSIGFIAWHHPRKLIVPCQQYKAASEEINTANKWAVENYGDYTTINYYIYSINKYTGLKFGNDFAKQKMLLHLKEVLPNTYFYEFSSNTYYNWNIKTSLHDIVAKNGKKILLMNGPGDPVMIEEMEELGFPLKQVYEGNAQNIFILDTLKYITPATDKKLQTGITLHFGAEQFSSDGKFFTGSNSEVFGPVNGLSTGEVRSGNYSVKLEKLNPFAVNYNLENTKAGELYQIDVWRKSNTSVGYLVVAADSIEACYRAQNEAVDSDRNGWDLLRINMEITKELEGKPLKIYLWNPSRRAAHFDNLSIRKFIADIE